MQDKRTLSVFVDESGILAKDDPTSRFYIVALVLHEQERAIAAEVERLDRELEAVGIANLCFHAGPLNLHDSTDRGETRGWRADDDG